MKPDSVLGQPVNLGGLSSVGRLVYGATVRYYVFEDKPKAGDLYRVRLEVAYTARRLFTDEPLVEREQVAGTASDVVHMNRDTRQQLTATVLWTLTPFLGATAEYKYGSLPPVFQKVDGTLNLGFTFKSKVAGGHPTL